MEPSVWYHEDLVEFVLKILKAVKRNKVFNSCDLNCENENTKVLTSHTT